MKNLLLSTCLIFVGFVACNAQTIDKSVEAETEEPAPTIVEVQPEYPGGLEAMYKFISRNVRYPKDAIKANIQGKIYIKFMVDSNGTVSDAVIVKGLSESTDAEALRVINAMPTWKPGTQKGKPVNVYFNLPIEFKLD